VRSGHNGLLLLRVFNEMRTFTVLALSSWLLPMPGQAMTDEGPASTDLANVEANDAAAEATPTVTTRALDPPTVVQPFDGPAVNSASSEVVAPLDLSVQTRQHLPPGPPNRLP
jgi:hypothetical protein